MVDQDIQHLTFLTDDITTATTPVGKTLAPIYQKKTKLSFMYNDETPTGKTSSSYGHTKGVIGADYSGGFWLIHSVPSFPPVPENSSSYGYPDTGLNYGQSFLCLSLSLAELNNVGKLQQHNHPQIYHSDHVSTNSTFVDTLPDLIPAISGTSITRTAAAISLNLTTIEGTQFRAYAKNAKWAKDLAPDLIVPDIKAHMIWETWMRPTQAPSCPSDGHRTVNAVSLSAPLDDGKTYNWVETKDHSKWGVSSDARVPITCIGDINRMDSQRKRGGGAVCLNNTLINKLFRQLITEHDDCPATDGETPDEEPTQEDSPPEDPTTTSTEDPTPTPTPVTPGEPKDTTLDRLTPVCSSSIAVAKADGLSNKLSNTLSNTAWTCLALGDGKHNADKETIAVRENYLHISPQEDVSAIYMPQAAAATVFSTSTGSLSVADIEIQMTYKAFVAFCSVTDAGALLLSGVTITGKTDSPNDLKNSLISVFNGGTLKLTNTKISSFTSKYPMIRTSSEDSVASSVTITGSEFTSLTRTSGDGAVLEYTPSSAFTLSGNSFTSCSSPDGTGGALMLTVVSGVKVELDTCVFTSCSANNGGAFAVSLHGKGSLKLAKVTLTSCAAAQSGGGLYLALTGSPKSLSLSLTYDYTDDEKKNQAKQYGNTLFVSSTEMSYIQEAAFSEFLSCDAAKNEEAYAQVTNEAAATIKNVLQYVNTECDTADQKDEDDSDMVCAKEYTFEPGTKQAEYLSTRYSESTLSKTKWTCFVLKEGTHNNGGASIDVEGEQVSIRGDAHAEGEIIIQAAKAKSTDQVLKYDAFTVDGGHLRLHNISLTAAARTATGYFYIVAIDGELTLTHFKFYPGTKTKPLKLWNGAFYLYYTTFTCRNSQFSDFGFNANSPTYSLFLTTYSPVYVEESSFTAISQRAAGSVFSLHQEVPSEFIGVNFTSCSSHESGGAISAEVTSSDGSISLANCQFESCSASQQGGGISLSIREQASLSVTGTTFSACKVLNGNGGAMNIYVEGDSAFTLRDCTFTNCQALDGQDTDIEPDDEVGDPEEVSFLITKLASTHRNEEQGEQVGYGGGVYVYVDGKPTSWTFSKLSFDSCTASSGAAFAAVADEENKDVLYSSSLWKDLASDSSGDNEYILGVVSLSEDGKYTVGESKEVGAVVQEDVEPKDVKPKDDVTNKSGEPEKDGLPAWAIVLIVILVVLVVAGIVAVVVVLCLRRKHSSTSDSDKA